MKDIAHITLLPSLALRHANDELGSVCVCREGICCSIMYAYGCADGTRWCCCSGRPGAARRRLAAMCALVPRRGAAALPLPRCAAAAAGTPGCPPARRAGRARTSDQTAMLARLAAARHLEVRSA